MFSNTDQKFVNLFHLNYKSRNQSNKEHLVQILLETIQKTKLFWTISKKPFNGLKIPALYVPRRKTWAKFENKK